MGRDEQRREEMILLHWNMKHALGDACNIRYVLSILSHLP